MTAPISADEARRLREAATPGPWTAADDTLGVRRVYSNGHDWMICTPGAANAALIAAAPDLAAEVERLTADNERLREALTLAERALRDQPMQAFRTEDARRRRAAAIDAARSAVADYRHK